MKKIHLIRTELPLAAGQDIEAPCGAKIVKAYFPCIFDVGMTGPIQFRMWMCRKCWDSWGENNSHYLYGAINGQESRTE